MKTPPLQSALRLLLLGPLNARLLFCCLATVLMPALWAGVPTITSFNLGPDPTLTSATFVVTFSEPVTGVDASDFAVNSTGTASAAITGVTADATGAIHTVAINYSGTSGSIQMAIKTAGTGIVSSSTSDAFVGGGIAASAAVTVNNVPPADATLPTVASFTAGAPSGSTVSFTVTFSEPVTGVDAGDFLVTRTGTATATLGAIAGTGTTYTIPVTFGGDGTIQLTAIGGATTNIRDAATHWFAGGPGAAGAVFTIPSGGTPDTTPPTVASFTTGATTAASVTFNLVFSEPVTGVDAADFAVAATGGATASIGGVSGSGASYAITVNFTGTGTVQLSLNASGTGILDAASNALATGASSPVYTIDSGGTPPLAGAAPTILSFTLAPDSTLTSGAFVVTFSEPVMGVDVTDFALNTTDTATAAITGVTQGATAAVYNVAFDYGGTSGSVQMAIKTAGTGIVSSSTSEAFVGGGVAASAAVTVNNVPPADATLPTVASFTAGAPSGSAVTFTLTFSEPVTGVDAADFLVTRTGTAIATLGAITPDGTGTTYTIPVTFGGDGTVQLTAIGGATTNIRDAATHWFAGGPGAASAVFTIPTGGGTPDATPPTVASFTIGATTATSVTFNLVFSEPVTGVDTSDFTIATTGGATASIGGVSGSGASYAIAVNFTGTGTVQLSLNASGTGIIDASSNALATGASSPVFTIGSGGPPSPASTHIIGITTPPDGSYRKGQELVFIVRFGGPVSIRPEPKGKDDDDDEDGDDDVGVYFTWTAVGSSDPKKDSGKVHYRSGNGTDTLTFRYKVRNGDFAPQGIRMGTTFLPDGRALHAGSEPTSQQLTLPWPQNPLTGVILDAPKLNNGNQGADKGNNNGVGIGVGGTPPGHGGTPPGQANPPAASTGNSGNAPGAVAGNEGAGNAGNGNSGNGNSGNGNPGNSNPGNGNSNNGNKGGDEKGNDDKTEDKKDDNKGNKDKEPKRGGALHPAAIGGLSNLSTRLRVTGGDANRSAVAGFVVSGAAPKSILVRAVGPGLASFGIRDALEQPRLLLSDSTGRAFAANDGWSDHPEIASANERVGAFHLAPGSRDAALLVTLAPGIYTAQVAGNGNGLVLLEVYDASSGVEPATEKIINISTRGFVGTGEDALVAGFVVTGDAPRRVLIRGVGPTLAAFGVSGALADPVLSLFRDGAGSPVAQSDDWQAASATATELVAAMASAGAFPLASGSRDAALVITLAPGQYSAILSGARGDTGAGLVEIYELP